MSILYKKYLSLKIEDSSYYYLFESGIFYIFIAEDAKFMSNKLDLKLTNLNSTIVKCGFPASQLNKYLSLFDKYNYPIKIITSGSFFTYSPNDYITNKKVKDFLKNLSDIKPDTLSISQSFNLLDNLANEAQQLLNEIENNS